MDIEIGKFKEACSYLSEEFPRGNSAARKLRAECIGAPDVILYLYALSIAFAGMVSSMRIRE